MKNNVSIVINDEAMKNIQAGLDMIHSEVGLKSVYNDLCARFPGRPPTKIPSA